MPLRIAVSSIGPPGDHRRTIPFASMNQVFGTPTSP
jgi:hypothetical protein